MSLLERQYNAGYLKKLLIMFFATFLVLAICNNIYAKGEGSSQNANNNPTNTTNDFTFATKACDIYQKFNPILSFIILVVVITTAIAALFGKLSMAVVVTVMITAIVMKQAPQIVNLITGDKSGSCIQTKDASQ